MADRDRPRALALAATAGETYRKLAGHEKQAGEIDAWLANKPARGAASPD